MVETVYNFELFHVTRQVNYNLHPVMEVGAVLHIGQSHNPFFGFYETPKTLPVHNEDGSQSHVHLIFWLERIADGSFQNPQAAQNSLHIAKHFQTLSRELGLELVRRDVAPTAPSRMKCLWTAESQNDADQWLSELGHNGRIVRLSATGTIHRADAALMLPDSVSHLEVMAAAERYWLGEQTDQPEPEVLFEGTAEVIEVLNS